MKKTLIIAIACAAALLFAGRAAAADPCADVLTDKGKVTGKLLDKKNVCEFKGIPYAAPPVGNLRFAAPRPPAPWTETLKAVKFGGDCLQYPLGFAPADKLTGGEDCLYLNVWQPLGGAPEQKPVMVFIHGGGFITGTAGISLYEGENLARKGDVVVVTLNYRLGVLGYFAHPALRGTEGEGNFGILDQVTALKWVKRNIANFGGDPNNVTIFGESAGGVSVGIHIISPASKGLFTKAIVESGPLAFLNKPILESEESGLKIAEKLGCSDKDTRKVMACFRALDAKTIWEAAPAKLGAMMSFNKDPLKEEIDYSFTPVIDGKLIPDKGLKLLLEGKFNKKIKLMIGSNKDEAEIFTLKRPLDTEADIKAAMTQDAGMIFEKFGIRVYQAEALALYKVSDFPSPRKAYNALVGDFAFTCPTLFMAKIAAANGVETRLYHFTKAPDEKSIAKDWGAFHGAELPFVFDQFTFMGVSFGNKANSEVADDMIALWSSFARDGTPSADGVPEWPLLNVKTGEYLEIGQSSVVKSNFKPDKCSYVEGLLKEGVGWTGKKQK